MWLTWFSSDFVTTISNTQRTPSWLRISWKNQHRQFAGQIPGYVFGKWLGHALLGQRSQSDVFCTRQMLWENCPYIQRISWSLSEYSTRWTHASTSSLTTFITRGRGLIVSKFPLGICKTKLMELGTTVTIRDPRSTRRRSHCGIPVPCDAPSCSIPNHCCNAMIGAKNASCEDVV